MTELHKFPFPVSASQQLTLGGCLHIALRRLDDHVRLRASYSSKFLSYRSVIKEGCHLQCSYLEDEFSRSDWNTYAFDVLNVASLGSSHCPTMFSTVLVKCVGVPS